MLSARLIKALERRGFFLDFPSYGSSEEIISEILKESNSRLSFSLPLFLMEDIDYKSLISKLDKTEKKEIGKIILISEKIYRKERIKSNISELIKKNKIRETFSKQEFEGYYLAFKESMAKSAEKTSEIIEKQSKLRLNLDMNKSLEDLFSPAKIRIMRKIFNHEKLTNTELKYYYRAISNINKAVLDPRVQDYLRIIEISKKFVEMST